MAAIEGVIKAIVSFYQDDSDTVFLGLSYDLCPNILEVQILIGLMVETVGLWSPKTFVWRRVTPDLRNGRPLEMSSISKLIKSTVASVFKINLRYMYLFS